MKSLYDKVCLQSSKLVTKSYSTSFSLGIRFLHADFHDPIYSIYGFVRFADEIVDTFHGFDKKTLLEEFKKETFVAIERKISLNPILNSFQEVVNKFQIDHSLIHTFLRSMEMDLEKNIYDENGYKEYILGSAEVVGLMCLKVFVEGDQKKYDELTEYAMALGSAFQKINFLRDLNADYLGLGRVYFPNVELTKMDTNTKREIELDIEKDFQKGYQGILMLPKKARLGVYVAYIYYNSLLKKIKRVSPDQVLENRIRIPNHQKAALFASSLLRHSFNLL